METERQKTQPARTAIIAGGTSGIGLATAVRLAEQGFEHIALIGRNEQRAQAAAEYVREGGAQAYAVIADVNDPEQVERAIGECASVLGSIGAIVVSVAASAPLLPVEQLELHQIGETIQAIAAPPMMLVRAVLPHMRESGGGAIVTIASDAAKVPTPGEAVVGASMAALTMFTRTLAMEVKRHGIRVNALTPSLVTGTGTQARIAAHPFSERLFERISDKAGLGVPTADDVAAMAAFLVGPDSAKMTGQVVSVNGGVSAG